MNRIKELFENLITFFRKDHPPKAVAEEVPDTELPEETVEPTYSRSGKHRSKPLSQHPFRRFWRRFHLTKILLIIGLGFSLFTGGYLFYLAKTTNVKDLQNALKATTIIYDKNGDQAGSLTGQKEPTSNSMPLVRICKMPWSQQRTGAFTRIAGSTMVASS